MQTSITTIWRHTVSSPVIDTILKPGPKLNSQLRAELVLSCTLTDISHKADDWQTVTSPSCPSTQQRHCPFTDSCCCAHSTRTPSNPLKPNKWQMKKKITLGWTCRGITVCCSNISHAIVVSKAEPAGSSVNGPNTQEQFLGTMIKIICVVLLLCVHPPDALGPVSGRTLSCYCLI